MPTDTKWKFPSLPGNTGKLDLDNSVLFGGSIGYKIPDGLRFELEASYVSYDVKAISINGPSFSASGDLSETVLFGNLIYDLPIADRWAIALGAGLGGGWVDADVSVPSGPASLSDTDAAFAWQLLAGVVFSILQEDARAERPRSELNS